MKAAWYERQGPASEVLVVGEMASPEPGEGEVRIRVAASGMNPGDIKKRQDTFGVGMPYPRVIPHSDGAGVIDRGGKGVSASREGERVWCFGAQSYRPFGTAAELVVVPEEQVFSLPGGTSFEQGACLGIPGITAHRAVHVAGPVTGRTVLVQGGAGAVGQCAVGLARHAGASVIATVRSEPNRATAERAGAHHVVLTRGLSPEAVIESVLAHAPDGVQHIVEVAFAAKVTLDEAVLSPGGQAKADAARDLNEALAAGWPGFVIDERFALESIADAHEWIEERKGTGRVVLDLGSA
jgi:NADPH2:quinone reductase